MDYNEFLETKKHLFYDSGIDYTYMPDVLFDFQKYIAEIAIKKGRYAVFVDTGLGKTLIALTIAYNYAKHTNKPTLIITPIAVAFQFIKETEKFDLPPVYHSKDGTIKGDIILCNYERLDKFDTNDFGCVILDESSILKNFSGKYKAEITTFMKKQKYRYLLTASPAPNDYIELGTSSEALGYTGYMEMLSKYFANNENNIRPQEIGVKWYLKPHAEKAFFKWVASWSITMRMPSDLGFSDERFILPKLIKNFNYVKNDKNWIVDNQIMMFGKIAKTMTEVRKEQQMTTENRCKKAVEVASKYDTSVYWCNFNYEGDLIEKLDNNAVQIKGSMKLEQKEEILIAFSDKQIKKLITKPKMTSFGLNWQHCNHTTYFPTWSYEQMYQALRRFYRFGQKNDVIVDFILSDGQKRVVDALNLKIEKANRLYKILSDNVNINSKIQLTKDNFNQKILTPKFLTK